MNNLLIWPVIAFPSSPCISHVSTLSNWLLSLQLTLSNAPTRKATDWVVPCKYLTSCSGDTHLYIHTHAYQLSLGRKSDWLNLWRQCHWNQITDEGVHNFQSTASTTNDLALKTYTFFFLSLTYTHSPKYSHIHIHLKGKVINREVMAGGKLKVIKSSPPCLNRWDEGSQAHLTLHFPVRLFLTPLSTFLCLFKHSYTYTYLFVCELHKNSNY